MISTKAFHTFQIESTAAQLIRITNENQLSQLSNLDQPFIILGQGSNTVFIDDYQGALVLNELKGITTSETDTAHQISVKSGENWHGLVKLCLAKNIYGFENLALIPGTAGAAPIQNIGAYGLEIERFITRVHYYDLTEKQFKLINKKDCSFGYRDSIFKHALKNKTFITQVDFSLPKNWQAVCSYAPLDTLENPTPQQIFNLVCETRKRKLPDPYKVGNSGSFFKNPVVSNNLVSSIKSIYPDMPIYPVDNNYTKLAAGWLIDKVGLKGFIHKNVAVHDAQALVLINIAGEATGQELLELIEIIREKVRKQFDIVLEPEVRCIDKLGEINI